MKVRFRRSWGEFSVGDVFEPQLWFGDWLVAQGYAECIDQDTDMAETAMAGPVKSRPTRGGLEHG